MLPTWLLLLPVLAFAGDPEPAVLPAPNPPAEAPVAAPEEAAAPAEAEAAPPAADAVLEVPLGAVKVKHRVAPVFPKGDYKTGETFECEVDIHLGADGHPVTVEVRGTTSCPEPFRAASEDAFGQTTWRPYKVDGTPVSVRFSTRTLFVK